MSYSKYYSGGFLDGESGGTPITAAALNHMEGGIVDLNNYVTTSLTRVTDCNAAIDPRLTYYLDGDSGNLNKPESGWVIVKSLFLNGSPDSTYSCCQICVPMNSSTVRMYIRSRDISGTWSAWKTVQLS